MQGKTGPRVERAARKTSDLAQNNFLQQPQGLNPRRDIPAPPPCLLTSPRHDPSTQGADRQGGEACTSLGFSGAPEQLSFPNCCCCHSLSPRVSPGHSTGHSQQQQSLNEAELQEHLPCATALPCCCISHLQHSPAHKCGQDLHKWSVHTNLNPRQVKREIFTFLLLHTHSSHTNKTLGNVYHSLALSIFSG